MNQLPPFPAAPSLTSKLSETLNNPPPEESVPGVVKLGFTGRLKVGKDFAAKAVGATIHGFAEPLYSLCQAFFGTTDKDQPGMRATLQTIGQWGRGVCSEQYPLSAARAAFALIARQHGQDICPNQGVAWGKFGIDGDIWLKACLARVAVDHSPVQAVVNIRFINEFNRLKSEGFKLIHVMCSPDTYIERLKKAGMAIDDPALRDASEQLALATDQQVRQEFTRNPKGPKLMAVWSDPNLPPPSARLMTLREFQSYVEKKKGSPL